VTKREIELLDCIAGVLMQAGIIEDDGRIDIDQVNVSAYEIAVDELKKAGAIEETPGPRSWSRTEFWFDFRWRERVVPSEDVAP
jgi:hypothetical protein